MKKIIEFYKKNTYLAVIFTLFALFTVLIIISPSVINNDDSSGFETLEPDLQQRIIEAQEESIGATIETELDRLKKELPLQTTFYTIEVTGDNKIKITYKKENEDKLSFALSFLNTYGLKDADIIIFNPI